MCVSQRRRRSLMSEVIGLLSLLVMTLPFCIVVGAVISLNTVLVITMVYTLAFVLIAFTITVYDVHNHFYLQQQKKKEV